MGEFHFRKDSKDTDAVILKTNDYWSNLKLFLFLKLVISNSYVLNTQVYFIVWICVCIEKLLNSHATWDPTWSRYNIPSLLVSITFDHRNTLDFPNISIFSIFYYISEFSLSSNYQTYYIYVPNLLYLCKDFSWNIFTILYFSHATIGHAWVLGIIRSTHL